MQATATATPGDASLARVLALRLVSTARCSASSTGDDNEPWQCTGVDPAADLDNSFPIEGVNPTEALSSPISASSNVLVSQTMHCYIGIQSEVREACDAEAHIYSETVHMHMRTCECAHVPLQRDEDPQVRFAEH